MTSILVIEDEADMGFILSDNLGAEGYTVQVATTGRQGLQAALSGQYALVLLDIMLPDVNGIEVCKQIRARVPQLPIIMLTAKDAEIDKVVGLEVGADDYVTKPFSMRELLARVKAQLRRATQPAAEAPQACRIGESDVDFTRQELTRGDRREALTTHETALLQLLAANRGQPVSRKRIYQEIWGIEATPSNRAADNYIARLRAKLETEPAAPRHILTVHGSGYKLV